MSELRGCGLFGYVVLAFLCICGVIHAATQGEIDSAELDRQRLIGAAHYENDHFMDAAAAFRRAIELAPSSAEDQFNLALVLMRATRFDDSLQVLEQVEILDPELLGVHYIRGIIFKNQERFREAVQSLQLVSERDPHCFGAFYNLGACHKKLENYADSRAAFEAAIQLDPQHPSAHYQVITLARRMGDVEGAQRHAEIFDQVKDTVDESEKTVEALERSRYSYLISVPRLGSDLEPVPEAAVRFVDVTEKAQLSSYIRVSGHSFPGKFRRANYDAEAAHLRWASEVGGAIALGDVDGDGDLDIYAANSTGFPDGSADRLYLNDGDFRFSDGTAAYGLGDSGTAMDALFGDIDNDGHDDLYVVNDGPNRLYRKQGDGIFLADGLEQGALAIALLELPQSLPASYDLEVELELLDQEGPQQNGFVILDYRGPEDYVYAGALLEEGRWTIGHYTGKRDQKAGLEDGIISGKRYRIYLRVAGGTVTLSPEGPDSEKQLTHDFGETLDRNSIGLAAEHGPVRFDNLRLSSSHGNGAQHPSSKIHEESFADGLPDLFKVVSGNWQVVDWTFADISEEARVNEPQLGRRAVFVDYDHDNDLDICVVNGADLADPPQTEEFRIPDDFPGQVNTLLRNNGNGTFDDRTDESGLLVDISRSQDLLLADLDSDNDTDLFIANSDHSSLLFTNLRQGRFAKGGSFDPPLTGSSEAATTGDFNHDGHLDLLVAIGQELRLYLNDGRAAFTGQAIPLSGKLSATGVRDLAILDYNNDGWSDLLLADAGWAAVSLLAGDGPASFRDVTAHVGLDEIGGSVTDLATGDIDGDGDEDLVLQTNDRGPLLLENRGGNGMHWIEVRPVGKKVNRNGYGATVEIAAEGHYQKRVVHEGPVRFGLGKLTGIDVVRIIWPNGVAQNIVTPPVDSVLSVDEYVKVSASCGFLYAHDGSGFKLINEILGIGALGAPLAPGIYHQPDHTELMKIEADQLLPHNGTYELRLTEELREITYADQVTLRVIDHPAELEIVPNEMFTAPPFPEDRFFAVAAARTPHWALDESGRDVLELIRRRDGAFPTFKLVPQYDGLAREHSLTMGLGDLSGVEWIMLYLDSWIYWPEASTSIALAQDPRYALQPLKLEVRGEGGAWQTAIESVGLPTSKGIVVPVQLSGPFPAGDFQIRLSTNMRIYFDRIFYSGRDEAERCLVSELPVAGAELHYRGFSALQRDRFGYERFDYHNASPTGSWSPPSGMLTRYGEVAPLLALADDRFVIFGPGDELKLQFDAGALPQLPAGWTRDFIFFADGWVKDGDLNTKYSETIEPLPFHGMSGYPYPASESYPDSPELQGYLEEYNSRPGVSTLGPLTPTGGAD